MRTLANATLAVLLGAVFILAACNDNTAPAPTVKAPPGIHGPTTAEVLAKDVTPAPGKVNLADYETTPNLGSPVTYIAPNGEAWAKYPDGMMIQDLKAGTGNYPRVGQVVTVKYVGTFPDGKEFDHSPEGQPLPFIFGKVRGDDVVIKGWNLAVSTMRAGGKRKVFIPADLAYGAAGGGKIPPNQPLVFDMELVGITGDSVDVPAATAASAPALPDLLKSPPAGPTTGPGK